MSQKQTHNTKPTTLNPIKTQPPPYTHQVSPPQPTTLHLSTSPPPHQATLNYHTHYVYPERHYFNQSKQKTALMKTTTTIP